MATRLAASPGPWMIEYDKRGFARRVIDRPYLSVLREHREAEAAWIDRIAKGSIEPDERRELQLGPMFAGGSRRGPIAYPVCTFVRCRRQNGANARLIAQAPALLQAAGSALEHLRQSDGPQDLVDELSRAIGMAEGSYVPSLSTVDDRAPLDRSGCCKGPACGYGPGELHDSMCGWLKEHERQSRETWPNLHAD